MVREPVTSSSSAKVIPETAVKRTTSETRPKTFSEITSATTTVSATERENAQMESAPVRPETSASELSATTVPSAQVENANALVAGRASAARKETFASMLTARTEEPAMIRMENANALLDSSVSSANLKTNASMLTAVPMAHATPENASAETDTTVPSASSSPDVIAPSTLLEKLAS